MAKPTIVFTYRGQVERATKRGYAWRNGYSETSAERRICFPYMTKRECQGIARARGYRAVFADASGRIA